MKFLKIWRTFKEGLKNFSRHWWLSLATIIIISLSLYVVSAAALMGTAANSIIKNIQSKVNISVYFKPEVSEKEILEIKDDLKIYQEIKSVSYISREQALDELLNSENNDPIISQALEEINENPLLSSLMITAFEPSQYEIIAQSIENSGFREKISEINYERNKITIENLNKVIALTEKVGIFLGVIFLSIAILITFNTIRLNMYSRKKEFEIMRLVGASNLYVQMPSIFEGIFYGVSAAVFATIFLIITARVFVPLTRDSLAEGDLLSFCFRYFWIIFFGIAMLGIMLGIISSFIAIRRYLKK